jgi:hypothetical protein
MLTLSDVNLLKHNRLGGYAALAFVILLAALNMFEQPRIVRELKKRYENNSN